MDDSTSKEASDNEFNPIDLTELADFSFGTQWSGGGESAKDKASRHSARRGDRPAGPGAGGPARKDRRPAVRRPSGDRSREGGRPDARPGRRPREGGRPAPRDHRPYVSPHFNVAFYPEDQGFLAMVKAMKASCRTYELFQIAQLILGKAERFVVVLERKPESEHAGQPLYISAPDFLPFESEDEAVNHVLRHHMVKFFETTTVEVEPPKGNFPMVMKCGVTGEILGPPNYHLYNQTLQRHHATKVAHLSFDAFKDRLESLREPEAIQAWLDTMKTTTRYTSKLEADAEAPPYFDTLDEARIYLLTRAREEVVRTIASARFHGRYLEWLPRGEIVRAIEGHLERQRRFPLDTANALRGRLRREGFIIFKKGSKGISYVSAIKRRFRTPDQVFSPTINALIRFIEGNPMVPLRVLPVKFLGLPEPEAPSTETAASTNVADAPSSHLSQEQAGQLKKLWIDLRWLVSEGYVTEYSDGRLFAPPPVTAPAPKAAREKKEDKPRESVEPETVADSKPPEEASSSPPPPKEEVSERPASEDPVPETPPASELAETSEKPASGDK